MFHHTVALLLQVAIAALPVLALGASFLVGVMIKIRNWVKQEWQRYKRRELDPPMEVDGACAHVVRVLSSAPLTFPL